MNILTIPYITGGLSHLIPLYVLHKKHIGKTSLFKNYFLTNNNVHQFLNLQGIETVPINYIFDEDLIKNKSFINIKKNIIEMEKKAYEIVKPSLIIEDSSFLTPLIAEKNDIPRISIQRTGIFRSINEQFRNSNHCHSLEKGTNLKTISSFNNNIDTNGEELPEINFFKSYTNAKVKIIPGIPSIECLPNNINNKESYFYSGPLIVLDRPSKKLEKRLNEFLKNNTARKIIFITTGTVEKFSLDKFIDFLINRNYAIITTCYFESNKIRSNNVFFNRILPLNYICSISDLIIHHCGSGMYHYPIINRIPSLTIGTLCYDREDIALKLQELGVSGHVPNPEDNPNYWNIFVELINKFENNTLIDFDMLNHLKDEIYTTSLNFEINNVINFALK